MTQIYLKYYLLRSKECTVPLPSRDGTGNGTSSTSRGVFDDGEVSGRQACAVERMEARPAEARFSRSRARWSGPSSPGDRRSLGFM
jgi:hypothetical protein